MELAELVQDVTAERVIKIAKSLDCDMIYLLKPEAKEEGTDDEEA